MSDPQATPIKVTATQTGFYHNILRAPGDTFALLDPRHFSKTWMTPADPETPLSVHEMSRPKSGRTTVPVGAAPPRSTVGD